MLNRFEHQLKKSGLDEDTIVIADFSWACTNIDSIKKEFNLTKYIVLFPFCSAHLTHII